ncbi:MAG: hypothetical protein FJ291_20095 [Planctomycetes bacterium]|nr:hypothetical protein [Planctomycetota bacterium]
MEKTIAELDGAPPPAEADPVLIQAILLDSQMEDLATRYEGKWVVFYDGNVLASGKTDEEALSQLSAEQRALPFVSRLIVLHDEPCYMGGPKGE